MSNETTKVRDDKSKQKARAKMLREEIAGAMKKGKSEETKKIPTPREFTDGKMQERKKP